MMNEPLFKGAVSCTAAPALPLTTAKKLALGIALPLGVLVPLVGVCFLIYLKSRKAARQRTRSGLIAALPAGKHTKPEVSPILLQYLRSMVRRGRCSSLPAHSIQCRCNEAASVAQPVTATTTFMLECCQSVCH